MSQQIILSPGYKGPLFIKECLRKMKSELSLGRIISAHNKRYFVLNLQTLQLYYFPEKGSHLADATVIPLESIVRVHEDLYLQNFDEDNWKYGLIIVTQKKEYNLTAKTLTSIQKLLSGFGHIINVRTNKPLFDWNGYQMKNSQTMSSLPKELTPNISERNSVREKEGQFSNDSEFEQQKNKEENDAEIQEERFQKNFQESKISANNSAKKEDKLFISKESPNSKIIKINPKSKQSERLERDNFDEFYSSSSQSKAQKFMCSEEKESSLEYNSKEEKPLQINIKINTNIETEKLGLNQNKKERPNLENLLISEPIQISDAGETKRFLGSTGNISVNRLSRAKNIGFEIRSRENNNYIGINEIELTKREEKEEDLFSENQEAKMNNLRKKLSQNIASRKRLPICFKNEIPLNSSEFDSKIEYLNEIHLNQKLTSTRNIYKTQKENDDDWDKDMWKNEELRSRKGGRDKIEVFIPRSNVHNDWDDELHF